MQTNIALTTETRNEIAQILNTILADEHVLYTKLRNYHWNITGQSFVSLHALLEDHYNAIKETADNIAERARMMGYHALGTMQDFLNHTRLEEAPGSGIAAADMLDDLLQTNESMIRNLRADVDTVTNGLNDQGTADLLIQTMRMHEKMAWMLRSLLEP